MEQIQAVSAVEEVNAARIFRLTLQLSAETLNGAAPEIEALGLEPKEFYVLDAMEEHPYPAELSRHLSMPKPTITAYLKNLRARELIARAIDPADLRRHRLQLTTSGRDVLATAQAHLFGRYGARLLRLSRREQDELVKILGKLVN